jgi:hypothetical protein
MAHWKRLTNNEDFKVDVNMDAVAYMMNVKDHAVLWFAGGRGDGKFLSLSLKETPDEVHKAPTIPTN